MGAQEFESAGKAASGDLTTVTVDGITLRYRTDGDATLPALVMSNSLGTDLTMWNPQIAALSQRFHVVRYDGRGHGASGAPPGPYSVERLGRDALGLMDAIGIGQGHFCGLSLGGMVGMWIAVNAASRIDRLALCNTAPRIGPPAIWNARIDRVRAAGMAAIADAILDRWFTASFRERKPDIMRAMREMLVAIPAEGYVASCAAVRDMDQWDRLATISSPTLVISATHDVATPPADGRRMAETIAGARYVELDASHISNIEAADLFTAELLQFLTA